jgi:hypothetical protein
MEDKNKNFSTRLFGVLHGSYRQIIFEVTMIKFFGMDEEYVLYI